MKRWIFALSAIAVMASCSSRPATKLNFPPTVSDWHLDSITEDSTPNTRKSQAVYQGATVITVQLTEKSSAPLAFSAAQDWRPTSGKLAFYKGNFFGIAQSPTADQRTLNKFVTAFEKSLPN